MTEISGRVVGASTWGCQGRRLGAGTRLGARAIFAENLQAALIKSWDTMPAPLAPCNYPAFQT